jgi:hypothetical protein
MTERRRLFAGIVASGLFLMTLASLPAVAQTNQQNDPQKTEDKPDATRPDTDPTVFPHSQTWPFFVGGQINFIFQAHPAFHAQYSGPQSLRSTGEHALSRVATLYLGLQATPTTEFLFDVEETGGRGISDAFGLAGFTNLDVVRNPSLGAAPYIARVMLHQIVPLSKKMQEADRSFLSLATSLPERRLEFRVGKLGTADFFDVNDVGTDSHLQFTNWTVDNNGGYDYAADTRGYTYGAIIEYQSPRWGVRFGELLMPKVANGIDLEFNLRRARAENLELEFRPELLKGRKTSIKPLAYLNHADMGSYRQAIDAFLAGQGSRPDELPTGISRHLPLLLPRRLERRQARVLRVHRSEQHVLYRLGRIRNAMGAQVRPRWHCHGDEWTLQRSSRIPRARRPGFSARRWRPELRPRKYSRKLLHPAHLARCLLFSIVSVHRESGIQPGPRSGDRTGKQVACGFLK